MARRLPERRRESEVKWRSEIVRNTIGLALGAGLVLALPYLRFWPGQIDFLGFGNTIVGLVDPSGSRRPGLRSSSFKSIVLQTTRRSP